MSEFLICVRLIGPRQLPPTGGWIQGELLSLRSAPGFDEEHPHWVLWIRPECEQVERACRLQAEAMGVGWELDGEGFTSCAVWEPGPGRTLCVDEVSFANIEVSGDPNVPEALEPDFAVDE